MSVVYVRNQTTNEFEKVGPGSAATDTTLSQAGKPADAGAVGAALTNYATLAQLSDQANTKVDKVDGKGLSTNDYTSDEKTKLAGIATGANKTVVDTALSSSSPNPVQNKVINSALSNCAKITDVNTKLSNIFGEYYDLATTVTAGENWTNVSGSATLAGNMLRVRFSADRTSPASGNISNETVVSFSIAHEGKITGGFAVSIGNGTSGHLANMLVSSVACNATALTFKITLTATGGETSSVNPFFAIPVLIDITKF